MKLNSSTLYKLLEQFNNFYNAHPNQHEFFHIYLKKFLGSGGAALIVAELNKLNKNESVYTFYLKILQILKKDNIPFELSPTIINKANNKTSSEAEALAKLKSRWHDINKRPQLENNIAKLASYYLGRSKLEIKQRPQAAAKLYEIIIERNHNHLQDIKILNDLILLHGHLNTSNDDIQKALVYAIRKALLLPDIEAEIAMLGVHKSLKNIVPTEFIETIELSDALWSEYFKTDSTARSALIVELAHFYAKNHFEYSSELVTLLCDNVNDKKLLFVDKNTSLGLIAKNIYKEGGFTIKADIYQALSYLQQQIIACKEAANIGKLADELIQIYIVEKYNLPYPVILQDIFAGLEIMDISITRDKLYQYQVALKSIWFPKLPTPYELRELSKAIHHISADLIDWHKQYVNSKLQIDLSKYSRNELNGAKDDLNTCLTELDKITLSLGHGLHMPTHIQPRRLSNESKLSLSTKQKYTERENFINLLADKLAYLDCFKNSVNRDKLTHYYAEKINECYEQIAILNDHILRYASALGCFVTKKENNKDKINTENSNNSNTLGDRILRYANALGCFVPNHANKQTQETDENRSNIISQNPDIETGNLQFSENTPLLPNSNERYLANPRKVRKLIEKNDDASVKAPKSSKKYERYLISKDDPKSVFRSSHQNVLKASVGVGFSAAFLFGVIGFAIDWTSTNTQRQWVNGTDIVLKSFPYDGKDRIEGYINMMDGTNKGLDAAYNLGTFVNVLTFIVVGSIILALFTGYETYQKLRLKPEPVGDEPQLFPLPALESGKDIELGDATTNSNLATIQPSILKAAKPFTERMQQLANRARFIKDYPGLSMFEQVSSISHVMDMPAKTTQSTFNLPITEHALIIDENGEKIYLLNGRDITEYEEINSEVTKLPTNDYLLLSRANNLGQLIIIENTVQTFSHSVLLKKPGETGYIAYEISTSINLKDLADEINHDIEMFKSNQDLSDSNISKAKAHITKYLAIAPLIIQNITDKTLLAAAREFTDKLRELLNILNQIKNSEQISENKLTLSSIAKSMRTKPNNLVKAINQKINVPKTVDTKKLKATEYGFDKTDVENLENDSADDEIVTPVSKNNNYNFFDSGQRTSIALTKYVEPTELKGWKELFKRIAKSTTGLPFKVSDKWGSSYGIYTAFKKIFGDTIYIIDPDTLSTTGSIFDVDIDEAATAGNALLKCISGYIASDNQRKLGILPAGGVLDKPLVVPLNMGSIKIKSATDGTEIGGEHWTVMVVLPGDPVNIFYINSCRPQEGLPEQFKTMLTGGSVNRFLTQDKINIDDQEVELTETHEQIIPTPFPGAQFIKNQNIIQQKNNGSDCAAWTVYNGAMIIFDKNTNFLEKFKNTDREPAAVVRAIFPDLTKDQPMPQYSPNTTHAKK